MTKLSPFSGSIRVFGNNKFQFRIENGRTKINTATKNDMKHEESERVKSRVY